MVVVLLCVTKVVHAYVKHKKYNSLFSLNYLNTFFLLLPRRQEKITRHLITILGCDVDIYRCSPPVHLAAYIGDAILLELLLHLGAKVRAMYGVHVVVTWYSLSAPRTMGHEVTQRDESMAQINYSLM